MTDIDIGRVLLDVGRIGPDQLNKARACAAETGLGLDEAFIAADLLSEIELADALGRHFEIPGFSLERLPLPRPDVIALVPEPIARACRVVPLERAGRILILLMQDPTDIRTVQAIRRQSELDVQPVVGAPATVREALETFYPDEGRKLLASALPLVAKLLSESQAWRHRALPVDRDGNVLTVAVAGRGAEAARRGIELATGLKVRTVSADWEDVERAIHRVYRDRERSTASTSGSISVARPAAEAPGTPITPMLSGMAEAEVEAALPPGGDVEVAMACDATALSPTDGDAGDRPPTRVDPLRGLLADGWELDRRLAKLVPERVARNYRVVPMARRGGTLNLAMQDPTDLFALETAEFSSGLRCEVVPATAEQVDAALEILYDATAEELEALLAELVDAGVDDVAEREELETLSDLDAAAAAQAAPIVQLVNGLVIGALAARASDIHVETYDDHVRVRQRVDGLLQEVTRLPSRVRDPLISRLKIMGRMNISERRLPQDGRVRLRKGGEAIDLRISSTPTVSGEKVVLRILDRANVRLDMTRLGLEPGPLRRFREAIHLPNGMVLVVGPSGCGKTNTLYSALADLNRPEINVMTCEDPVELSTAGLNQIQATERGLSFAAALRSFLRQDPDVILVGEVRDSETAEIAMKAALTGHLVLTTLHAAESAGCVHRMTNMGIEPFLVASALRAVVAQRLVRKICPKCRERDLTIRTEHLLQLGFAPEDATRVVPARGRGCPDCEGSGYLGRTGIFEVLRVSETVRALVNCNAPHADLAQLAVREGMQTLRQAGLAKVRAGITSCEEVVRETL